MILACLKLKVKVKGKVKFNYVKPDGSLLYLQVLVPRSLRTAFLDAPRPLDISSYTGLEADKWRS